MKLNISHCLTLVVCVCFGLAGCGGSSDNQPVNNEGKTPITKPDPQPNPNPDKKVAEHSVKRSNLGNARVQKASSGRHDVAASVTVVTQKASSENFGLSGAAIN
ncbi:hypothetical protein [Pseudoalteromonas luteoviolacea]|uniref:Uncharacterized protein n=1 Tax=Pseudoalteromonas luteoviolacea DSM 6061 TaxID=1365250 RepID=A0A161XTD7_9GAMM|nr:hypothetical protein [Pseudoalteromonas luteoviolacea]KZN29865.1 hypothetical protein N475_25090 [Pseudoalteromonas luteoviolacea DSM 6061]KZN52737.1 hypothetical protein N474_22470 [Pseudoalteromonas luteoviolacea CPMOR-2]MBE0389684.1 hypothetical protein [Pseudoalteromonas luteoviolacea DSM 6061]TQF67708.1 hypothetical protein FLM44_21250 [Pseudoalteromonas luteoviolacea]